MEKKKEIMGNGCYWLQRGGKSLVAHTEGEYFVEEIKEKKDIHGFYCFRLHNFE